MRITGLFERPADAAAAIDTLAARGIDPARISLVAGDRVSLDAFTTGTEPVRTGSAGTHTDGPSPTISDSKMLEGLAVGTGAGAAAGALVAGLAAAGTLGAATGGFGLLAAGPITAALAGGSLAGVAGGSLGAAVGSVIPEKADAPADPADPADPAARAGPQNEGPQKIGPQKHGPHGTDPHDADPYDAVLAAGGALVAADCDTGAEAELAEDAYTSHHAARIDRAPAESPAEDPAENPA